MSSDGAYARGAPGGSNNNPYGQSYSAPSAGGYGGGYAAGGSGYGSGPAPGYGTSYPAPRYNGAGAPANVQLGQVRFGLI